MEFSLNFRRNQFYILHSPFYILHFNYYLWGMKTKLLFIPMIIAAASCSHKTEGVLRQADTDSPDSEVTVFKGAAVGWRDSRPVNAIPKATVFRMSGDYADNVAITLNSSGQITYFPDPQDISAATAPQKIGDGWWLNRQGISSNSVFTRYTRVEYAALPNVPSPTELKKAIIPGAKVTEMRELPFSISEVPADMGEILKFLQQSDSSDKKLKIKF